MTDQLANLSDPSSVSAAPTPTSADSSSNYDTVPTLRLTGTRKCPSCDGDAPAHASVCPECGDVLQTKAKKVRCRRCGNFSTSELVICPYCGRELQPAPPRLLTWGVPIVVVGLFFLLLFSRWNGRNPFVWTQLQLVDSLARVGILGASVESGTIIVMTPIPGNSEAAVAIEEKESETEAALDSQATQGVAVGDNGQDPFLEDNGEQGDGEQADGMAVLTPTVTELLSATPVPTTNPIEAISPAVLSPTPPQLPTEMLAATQAPGASGLDKVVPAVKALSLNLSTATPLVPATKAVQSTASSTIISIRTPEPLPSPTPRWQSYEIKAGDTLLGISSQFGVDVETLMEANNIAPTDAYTIQPGETIVIPVPSEKVEDQPTPAPTRPSTQAQTKPPKSAATPAIAVSLIRLDAPVLRSPENGATASCSEPVSLVWLAVPSIGAEDKFVLHLGFTSGRNENNEEIVTWVLAHPGPATVTSWDMDGNLCGLAPQDFGRQWRWWVEVAEDVDGESVPASPPSEIWGFSWN